MMKRSKVVRTRAAQTSDRHRLGWGGALIALVIVASALIIWQWPGEVVAPSTTGGIPTPIGFPDAAQDVGTLVGEAAPIFTLPDETGASITVEPGAEEKPTVLIFNMGLG